MTAPTPPPATGRDSGEAVEDRYRNWRSDRDTTQPPAPQAGASVEALREAVQHDIYVLEANAPDPSVDDYTNVAVRAVEHWLAQRDAAVRAEAWDEGYTAGHSNAMRRMSDEPNAPTSPNPYRFARTTGGDR